MAISTDIHAATDWDYFSGVPAADITLRKTSRAIRPEADGTLVCHTVKGDYKRSLGPVKAGDILPIQTDKISTDTTCDGLLVFYQDD